MNHPIQQEQIWKRQPFTTGEFFVMIGIPVSFVIVMSTLLFIMVIRAGG